MTPQERLVALVNSDEFAHVKAEAEALQPSYPYSLTSPVGAGLNALSAGANSLSTFIKNITPVEIIEPAPEDDSEEG